MIKLHNSANEKADPGTDKSLTHVTTTFQLATPITMPISPVSRPISTKDVLEQ